MTDNTRDTLGAMGLLFAVTAAVLLLLTAIAHAGPVPAEAAPSAATGIADWTASDVRSLIALIGVGLLAVIEAARAVLHFTAPRTKTTLDDRAAARLDQVHDLIVARLPAPAPAPSPPPSTSAGGPAVLIVLIVIGLAGAQTACTAAQRTATPPAIVDCTAANGAAIGEVAISMRGTCALPNNVVDWGCVTSKAIVAGLQIGGCAFLEVLTPSVPDTSVAARSPTDEAGIAAFEDYRARHAGGATFRTAIGLR